MISDKRAEQALNYLVETDQEHARIKAEFKAKEALTKTIVAYEFRDAKATAQEAKKMEAYASQSYTSHIEAIKVLEIELQTMYNKRDSERLVIEMWRHTKVDFSKKRCSHWRRDPKTPRIGRTPFDLPAV